MIRKMPGVRDVVPIQVFTNNCRASLDVVVFYGTHAEQVRKVRDFELVSGSWEEFEAEPGRGHCRPGAGGAACAPYRAGDQRRRQAHDRQRDGHHRRNLHEREPRGRGLCLLSPRLPAADARHRSRRDRHAARSVSGSGGRPAAGRGGDRCQVQVRAGADGHADERRVPGVEPAGPDSTDRPGRISRLRLPRD